MQERSCWGAAARENIWSSSGTIRHWGREQTARWWRGLYTIGKAHSLQHQHHYHPLKHTHSHIHTLMYKKDEISHVLKSRQNFTSKVRRLHWTRCLVPGMGKGRSTKVNYTLAMQFKLWPNGLNSKQALKTCEKLYFMEMQSIIIVNRLSFILLIFPVNTFYITSGWTWFCGNSFCT